MLQSSLKNAVTVDNPAEVLRNQAGTFEVVSPYGLVFQVVCRPGSTMKMREVSQPPRRVEPVNMNWQIRRVDASAF